LFVVLLPAKALFFLLAHSRSVSSVLLNREIDSVASFSIYLGARMLGEMMQDLSEERLDFEVIMPSVYLYLKAGFKCVSIAPDSSLRMPQVIINVPCRSLDFK